MECLLHIAYRIDIKTWQVRGEDNKKKVLQRKIDIQNKFKSITGLLIDIPKQTSGNTNDGNTARRFFRNAEVSAQITGLNIELIKRFHVILECLASGYAINPEAFESYASETRQLYLNLYHWYLMPVSVHKVLWHGKIIIQHCILPIGQLSEEAQESRNKDIRRYRLQFTRKTSRIQTQKDLVRRLLISSDPYICSLRKTSKIKRRDLTSDILNLLENTDTNTEDSETENDIYSTDSE